MSVIKSRPLIMADTALSAIPRTWLELIEPHIKREGSCWLWTGAVIRGHPVLGYTLPNKKRSSRRVARIVAEMFWDLEPWHDVLHGCRVLTCLNPHHFYVTDSGATQEDREAIIAKKALRIARYNRDGS